MFPFFLVWSPHYFLPWSGGFAQEIDLERFFGAIPRSAGDGDIEYQAFKRASYGAQLGWITDILLASMKDRPAPEGSALDKLRRAHADIEMLKLPKSGDAAEHIVTYLGTLRQQDSARHAALSAQLLPLLAPPPAGQP